MEIYGFGSEEKKVVDFTLNSKSIWEFESGEEMMIAHSVFRCTTCGASVVVHNAKAITTDEVEVIEDRLRRKVIVNMILCACDEGVPHDREVYLAGYDAPYSANGSIFDPKAREE